MMKYIYNWWYIRIRGKNGIYDDDDDAVLWWWSPYMGVSIWCIGNLLWWKDDGDVDIDGDDEICVYLMIYENLR